jgi:tetratricopeptide (TPR) repeat protein
LTFAYGTLGIAEGTCGGDVPKYLSLIKKQEPYAEQIEDPGARVAAISGVMYPTFLSARYEESLASLDSLLAITDGDLTLGAGVVVASPQAWATSFRAAPLIQLGRFDEALDAIAEGIRLCEIADRESLGWTHTFQVNAARCGRFEWGPETLAYGRQAAEIADELGDGFSRVVGYAWLGLAQLWDGQPDAALQTVDAALATLHRRGVGLEYEPILGSIRGRTVAALGDLEGAVSEGRAAVALGDQRGVRFGAPMCRTDLAASLADRGDPGDLAEAATMCDEAIADSRSCGARPDLVLALALRARVHVAAGEAGLAKGLRAEALELSRSIGATCFVKALEAEVGAVA